MRPSFPCRRSLSTWLVLLVITPLMARGKGLSTLRPRALRSCTIGPSQFRDYTRHYTPRRNISPVRKRLSLRLPTPRSSVSVNPPSGVRGEDGPLEGKRMEAAVGAAEGVKTRVSLRIYNIDKYGLSRLGSKALKKDYNAIWHVAICAFGSEFWFDHKINEEDLEGIEVRFGYEAAEIVDLGETNKTHEELRVFLEELRTKYNVETYDCFYHNCHNFANEVANWLTGQSIPQWCLDHGGEALSNLNTKDAETIRWASNKIAKIMMVSWGRYNKERFDRKFKNQEK